MNWKDDSMFPLRLRQVREDAGLLQSEFAERLGVARSSISLYETGDRVPDIRFLDKVIEEFGCSYDYLMGRSAAARNENVDISKATGLNDEALSIVLHNADALNEIAHFFSFELSGLLALSECFLTGRAFNPGSKPLFDNPDEWLSEFEAMDFILNDIIDNWVDSMQIVGFAGLGTEEVARLSALCETAGVGDKAPANGSELGEAVRQYSQNEKRGALIIRRLIAELNTKHRGE